MKKIFLSVMFLVAFLTLANAQKNFQWTPFLHQTGMYFTSDQITSDGFGAGIGIHALHKTQIAGQADVNILWGNGNAITTRLALGYEKKGSWTPGIYATMNLIWGQKVQILSETGEKPPVPAMAFGIRLTPLKFQTKTGYVSALEFGYGFSQNNGMSIEFSLLSVGLKFK